MARTKKANQVVVPTQNFFDSIKPVPEYVKHLVECKCFLPHFKHLKLPPIHKFVVFSELDDNADIKSSYAQCNNCGSIHKVIEVGISEITNKEDSKALLVDKEEIVGSLPAWLVEILKKYDCDLATYQEAQFIISNKLWGRAIILVKEREKDKIFGKSCQILGENLHKIESFEREE